MANRWPALTEKDEIRGLALHAAAWHLDTAAWAGQWDAVCARIHERLGFYGLGRN